MKKKAARKHLDKLWKKMQKHFKDFTRTESPEALHQFRVQVKKIRSFLTLLENNKKNRRLLETFKPVKKLFKSAGVIRDAFLHQQEAKTHNIQLPQFYKEQAALQKEETKKLVNKRKRHLHKIKSVIKSLKKNLHLVTPGDIKTFFEQQLNNTQQLLSVHNFSEQLHDGRKMLKHLMYNEHLMQDGLAKEIQINFKYIDNLQNVLGQWHDNKLALELFSDDKFGNKDVDSMKLKNEELEKAIINEANCFMQKINAVNYSNAH